MTAKQDKALADSLDTLGDLGGVVHDLNSDEVIGGNQRGRIFSVIGKSIEQLYNDGQLFLTHEQEADRQGTVALGYILWNGARYAYRAVRWTEAQCAEANIKANLLGGSWDFGELANWDSSQLMEYGFDSDMLKDWNREAAGLAGMLASEEEPPKDAAPQVDKAEALQEKWKVGRGQLYAIGDHRLLCGDSTSAADVARVMDGNRAVLFATDPPYGANAGNIGFTAQRDDIEAITKDNLEGKEMQAFLELAFRAWIPSLADNAGWYLWHPMLTQGYFAAAAAAADLIIHRQIIWVKEQFIFGRGDYHWRHELCFYGWRKGHRPQWFTERNQDTVWNIEWGDKRSDIGHPTAKPPEIFARPMRNHTVVGDICAEPFAGSGSQFVAGENLKRRVFGVEIEPKFCAVILQRMLDAFGLEPRLVESGA